MTNEQSRTQQSSTQRPVALLSVYDKTGIVEFASALRDLGWALVASGNTSAALTDAGVEHRQVEELTGFPEMLDGRVKTLHPMVHAAILADRSKPEHLSDLAVHRIQPIDLVVCNLYPFSSQPSIELIDVGGPTMVRAAAKNNAHVGIVTDPSQYESVLGELRADRRLSDATRHRLAAAAFAHTAEYDAQISAWFEANDRAQYPADSSTSVVMPPRISLQLEKATCLRYGENPHVIGARYREVGVGSWWDEVHQHGGMDLSYLNVLDADAAWQLVNELGEEPAAVVVKHANPCGVAVAHSIIGAYDKAFECDPVSAFGGVVALNHDVDDELAEHLLANAKADVVIAPRFASSAIERLAKKRKNLRMLSAPLPGRDDIELRRIGGGYLAQQTDRFVAGRDSWSVVTKVAPTEAEWRDLELAWKVCAWVKSNAIVLVANEMAVGIGAGQPSRLDAGRIAAEKAAGRAQGGACASDAFFPFRDGLDVAVSAGVSAVIQPGGSIRDEEVITAADEHGIAMVFTGERHFRH